MTSACSSPCKLWYTPQGTPLKLLFPPPKEGANYLSCPTNLGRHDIGKADTCIHLGPNEPSHVESNLEDLPASDRVVKVGNPLGGPSHPGNRR